MEQNNMKPDGIHAPVPRDKMPEDVRRCRDAYNQVPGAPLYHTEFGYYCKDAWRQQGLPEDVDFAEYFHFNRGAKYALKQLGWTDAPFYPEFKEEVLEDRGDTEIARDKAGRHVLFFKGRRQGFMPEYLENPVTDMQTWEQDVKWRLDPSTPERYEEIEKIMPEAIAAAGEGRIISQRVIGGYMYLRSLIGPEKLLYMFYDNPDLLHDCMQAWLTLADAIIAKHQEYVTIDELFLAEDICYNAGPLIGPDMMREFLLPYYQQLISNLKSRQLDRHRHLFVQIDTDGYAETVIDIYQQNIGMDVMSPFEVASGSDVVEIGHKYPGLIMSGGIDKRVLATTKSEIDKMVERIVPPLRNRGGYIPTCDHGVPAEVPLENYLHYRERMVELGE